MHIIIIIIIDNILYFNSTLLFIGMSTSSVIELCLKLSNNVYMYNMYIILKV